MNNRNGIFVFTKNREQLLKRTTGSLQLLDYPVHIIDDSTMLAIRSNIELYCSRSEFHYHGVREQKALIESILSQGIDIQGYLKILGDGQWNLGYARNHALLIAAQTELDKVLFIDDDISFTDPRLPDQVFSTLEEYEIIGSKIFGMPDDSIIGHIASRVGICQPRLYSGGYIAFRTGIVDDYFLNVYNEDWIWQYMQLKNRRHRFFGQVYHEIFDPFENWKKKILFQEIGEMLVDGMEHAVTTESQSIITDEYYWKKQIVERKKYLQFLKDKCLHAKETIGAAIIDYVVQNYIVVDNYSAGKLFNDYFSTKIQFQKAFVCHYSSSKSLYS